jgi:hypothetical protein
LTVPFGDFDSPLSKRILKKYGEEFILNGTFDGVYRDKADRKIKLMEHKTAASISVRHLPMDNQAGTYWMVAQAVGRSQGWLGPKANIAEILYNFLRKSLPSDKPRDALGYTTNLPTAAHYEEAFEPVSDQIEWPRLKKDRTRAWYAETAQAMGIVVLGDRAKVQPPALFERHPVKRYPRQRQMQMTRLQGEVMRMITYREGWLPLTKSPDRNNCSWCPFNDMCELHESGADWEGYRDLMFRTKDPYADHRKSASAA